MNKLILGLTACGLVLSSCSSNEVFDENLENNNPNVINFSATTTRATVNDLSNVKTGFPVYAVTTKAVEAWHIQGATYSCIEGSWLWSGTAQKWPELAKFPMNFYAYYPANHLGYAAHGDDPQINAPIPGSNCSLQSVITIQATADTQADYLAANNTGIVRPMTTVPLQFKHITTKINFGVIAAEGTKSYIQQLNINNVKNQGTYDYVTTSDAEKWGTTATVDNSVANKYNYYQTPIVTDKKVKPVVIFSGVVEDKPESFYPCTPEGGSLMSSEDKHLMLLPQSDTEVWKPVVFTESTGDDNQKNETPSNPEGKTITPLKAYIGSVYRMTTNDGNTDLVGYSDASKHPNYDAETHKYLAGKPLFVKVGFPLNTGFSWVMGKAYTYNISLGGLTSTGGYLLDNRYYDDTGKETDLLIGGTNPGEPVSGGTINFDVTVGNWDDSEQKTIN